MKEFVSAGIHEALRKRLIAAVTEVCRDETFYVEKMRIEGTLCVVSDRNSFFVFQITELIGSKNSEDSTLQRNISSEESDHFNHSNGENSQQRNKTQTWLDEVERASSVETDTNRSMTDFQSNQSLTDEKSASFGHTQQVLSSSQISNSQFIVPASSVRKSNLSRPGTRLRRKMTFVGSDNNENSNANIESGAGGELLQTIKQEAVDFGLDESMGIPGGERAGEDGSDLLKMSTDVDLSVLDIEGMSGKRRPYKARGGINSYAFSGRCYEEIYVRTPHGLYRYMCRLCNSMFKIRNGLYEHLNGHFGRRPHACRQCDARFAHHSSLHNHVRNKHSLQTEEEKQAALRHSCGTCGRRFRYPSELERHKAVHDEFPVNHVPSASGGFGPNVLANGPGAEAAQQMAVPSCPQDMSNQFEFQILDHLVAIDSLQNGDAGGINIGTS